MVTAESMVRYGMSVTHVRGDLLDARVDALVNPVNCVGVMGKGLALAFKRAHPAVFREYARACAAGEVVVGRMHTCETGRALPRWVINFPTKRHYREPSRLIDVESGLVALVAEVRRLELASIAIPALGCGLGGLAWDDVRPRIEAAVAPLSEVDVRLFGPGDG